MKIAIGPQKGFQEPGGAAQENSSFFSAFSFRPGGLRDRLQVLIATGLVATVGCSKTELNKPDTLQNTNRGPASTELAVDGTVQPKSAADDAKNVAKKQPVLTAAQSRQEDLRELLQVGLALNKTVISFQAYDKGSGGALRDQFREDFRALDQKLTNALARTEAKYPKEAARQDDYRNAATYINFSVTYNPSTIRASGTNDYHKEVPDGVSFMAPAGSSWEQKVIALYRQVKWDAFDKLNHYWNHLSALDPP